MTDAVTATEVPPLTSGTFRVRFRPQKGVSRQPNDVVLTGWGEIEFAGDDLSLRGRQNEFFGFGSAVSITVQRHQIVNVLQDGRTVRFDVLTPDRPPMVVKFRTDSESTARTIVGSLPDAVTEAAARTIAESNEFANRLQAVGGKTRVTAALVLLNVLVFVFLSFKGAGVLVPDARVAAQWGSNFGPATLSGQWWRLLTSMFIHFGIIHLALNMFALYQTGLLVERMYGSVYFLMLYLFAGISGSIVSVLWHPSINSAGASGAIFGVYGALLVFMLDRRTGVPPSIVASIRNSTFAFIAYNLLNGFANSGIDNGAHLGGLVGGAVMGVMLTRPLEETRRRNPLPRLAGALAAGLLLLGSAVYLCFPQSMKEELKLQHALTEFVPKEQRALNDYDGVLKRVQQGQLDQAGAAREIDQYIIPQWDNLYDSLAAAKLTEQSRRLDLQYGLERYCDLRRKHLRLVIAAFRTGDSMLQTDAQRALEDIKAQIEVLKHASKP